MGCKECRACEKKKRDESDLDVFGNEESFSMSEGLRMDGGESHKNNRNNVIAIKGNN